MIATIVLLGGILVTATGATPVSIVAEKGGYVLENEYLRLRVSLAGGRLASLLDRRTGQELVALWKGGDEIGGLLDDRLQFTRAWYQAEVEESPSAGILRLSSTVGDLRLEKRIVLNAGERGLRVGYRLANGQPEAARLWVRNFPMPGGPPLSERHFYLIPRREGLFCQPFASEYFGDLSAPWAALRDTVAEIGLLAVTPGVEQFYFWQGSREYPTFEWLYPEIPAGQWLAVELALAVVEGVAPDWERIAGDLLQSLSPPRRGEVEGWVDESRRFAVTRAEETQGFWLSTGRGKGKKRLSGGLELDLPLAGERAIYVGLNALDDFAPDRVAARLEGDLADWVQLAWERREENAVVVEATANPGGIALVKGSEQRLWLLADAQGREAGLERGEIVFEVGGHQQRVPLQVRIWPVHLPSESRPFEVRGYATLTDFTGGYEVNEASLQRLEALLGAYARMGGSVFDWTVVWAQLLERVKIAGGEESLAQVARQQPERLNLNDLPALDFSYCDPWLEVARRQGVTRVETYMDMDFAADSRWQWACLDPAVGKGRVQAGTPAADQVIVWLYGELRRYFESQGFRGFFCKIADEISPEHLPLYSQTARLARQAGWRPFTTVTGILARSPDLLEAMDPDCDQWQVALGLKDDFRRLARVGPEDEVWFYGGGSRPFTTSYEGAYGYPLLAVVEGVAGYGWWAFQWWQASEKIVWYDPQSGIVRWGPAFLGLRDGWEDARLFHWVVRQQRILPLERVVGEEGVVRLQEETAEIYRWTAIAGLESPTAVNRLRQVLLQAAAENP